MMKHSKLSVLLILMFFAFFSSNLLFSVTAPQYHQEQVISTVKETLKKGEQVPLDVSEKLQVKSNLLEIERYSPARADAIREHIEKSPSLRQQFADFPERVEVKSEITQSSLTPQEIEQKLPVFTREVTKDIDTNVNNKKELTKQLLSNKEIAVTLDAALCSQGNCTQPFLGKMDQIILEKSQKTGININQLLTSPTYTITEEEVDKTVSRDLEDVYDVTISGTSRDAIEQHIKNIQNIGTAISAMSEKTLEERLDKKTGYYYFVKQIEKWWSEIEDNPDINPAESEQLREAKEKVSNILVDLLIHDVYKEFEQFKAEYIAAGEDFPYYQITKIQEAVRTRKEQFLESKALYGNPEIKKDLDTKYEAVYQLFEKASLFKVLNSKHIYPIIIDTSGNPLPAYKKSVNMIRLRLFGKFERLKTFNTSSLASLLWSIAYYISRITVNIEKNKEKAMELVKLYFEHNFNLLIQYRTMFQAIIPPKSVETVIDDIVNMIEPALDTETKLKFAKQRHIVQPETETTNDW